MVDELDRLTGPWKVVRVDDVFQVVDATGRFILAVTHRQDLHKIRYTHAGNYLTAHEAETIASAVAKLREGFTMRRALMSAADAAWFHKPKRGRYHHRSVVRFGAKCVPIAARRFKRRAHGG